MTLSLLFLQGCVTVNPYPDDWPALQREKVIGSTSRTRLACPLIAGTYANEGSRFPADATPRRLTDFFPLRLEDVSQVLSVQIDQTERTLDITVIKKDGTSETGAFKLVDYTGTDEPLRTHEFRCIYDLATKDRGFKFSGSQMYTNVGVWPYMVVLTVEGRAVYMRTAADRSLVVTEIATAGAVVLLVVPEGQMSLKHYRFPAADAVR